MITVAEQRRKKEGKHSRRVVLLDEQLGGHVIVVASRRGYDLLCVVVVSPGIRLLYWKRDTMSGEKRVFSASGRASSPLSVSSDESKMACMSSKKAKISAMDVPKRVTFATRDDIMGEKEHVNGDSGVIAQFWDKKDDLALEMAAAPLTTLKGGTLVEPVSWNAKLQEGLLADASTKWETLEPHLYCCKEVVDTYTKPEAYNIAFKNIGSLIKQTKYGVKNGLLTPRLGVTIVVTYMFDLLMVHQMEMEKKQEQHKFDDSMLVQSVEMLCAMKESVYCVGWYGPDGMTDTSESTYDYDVEDKDSIS